MDETQPIDPRFVPMTFPAPVEIPDATPEEQNTMSFRLKVERMRKALKKQRRQLGL
jgi:hypothetical protein